MKQLYEFNFWEDSTKEKEVELFLQQCDSQYKKTGPLKASNFINSKTLMTPFSWGCLKGLPAIIEFFLFSEKIPSEDRNILLHYEIEKDGSWLHAIIQAICFFKIDIKNYCALKKFFSENPGYKSLLEIKAKPPASGLCINDILQQEHFSALANLINCAPESILSPLSTQAASSPTDNKSDIKLKQNNNEKKPNKKSNTLNTYFNRIFGIKKKEGNRLKQPLLKEESNEESNLELKNRR